MLPQDNPVNYSFQVEAEPASWPSEQFIAWVRQQLRRRHWNDAEFARQLGMPSGTISRWLTGERQPKTSSCDLIADVFGVDVDLVLTLAGHRPAPLSLQPDDPLMQLFALLKRATLTPDRLAGLTGQVRAWIEFDRTTAAGARAGDVAPGRR
jgi:transcriptional regulator with XRE-family HTH domain